MKECRFDIEVFVIGVVIRVDGINAFRVNSKLREHITPIKSSSTSAPKIAKVKVSKKRGVSPDKLPEIEEVFRECGKELKNVTIISTNPETSFSPREYTRISISPVLPNECVKKLVARIFGREVPYRYEYYSVNVNILGLAYREKGKECYTYFDVTKFRESNMIKLGKSGLMYQVAVMCGDSIRKVSVMINQAYAVASSTVMLPVGQCDAYSIAEQIEEALVENGVCQVMCEPKSTR